MATEADAISMEPCIVDYNTTAALTGGQVIQLPSGRAGVVLRDKAATSAAAPAAVATHGIFSVDKASSVVLLAGGRVFWDHSANNATYKPVNDRDFYLGTVVADAASTDTSVQVNLNVQQATEIDLLRDAALSVATGTAAAGGFGLPAVYGNARGLSLTATNEAQCVDMLSVDRRSVSSKGIAEFIVRLGANGSTSAVDINVGLANGTSTTDADAVTEHVFFHIDGGALDILAQSKDGTTTVTATDTTIDATAGSAVANRFEFWIDARDTSSVKLYINGARVLSGTTFVLSAATGPLGLLAHVEKTSGTATAGPVYIDRAVLRTVE